MKTLLFIEDNYDIKELYNKKFTDNSWRVLMPDSYDEGCKMLNQYGKEIDVIVLDIMLPDKLGYELIPCIKTKIRDIPIIIFSNIQITRYLDLAYKNGATHDFLKVDFTPKQFIKKVEEIHSTYNKESKNDTNPNNDFNTSNPGKFIKS